MGEAIDFFNDAESIAERIIHSLADLSDEQLHEARRRASEVGAQAWRIKCAVDAEFVRRSTAKGEKKELIAQHAAEIGVAPRTIYRNAQIADVVDSYRETVTDDNSAVTINKSDVIESLRSDNPVQALAAIVEQKTAHVAYNAGNNEWYSPQQYIASARAVMGAIDTDPASSAAANEIVGAAQFFDAESDGLKHCWQGRVWMNPPYAGELIGQFAAKLVEHYNCSDVSEAIVLVNNATETAWFCRLAEAASAIVFPKGRVRFWEPGGKLSAPLQGQAIIYLGSNRTVFLEEFGRYGWGAVL